MGKYGGVESRNHGYGRDLAYAGRQAVEAHYGGGHYASVAAHSDRWGQFAAHLREQGVRDMRDVTPEHVRGYAEAMAERGLAVSTQQNHISTVNVVLSHAREGQWDRQSPAALAGERSSVRDTAPATADRDTYRAAVDALREQGHDRAASVVEMAREMGLREREAALADTSRLQSEAAQYGAVNVQEGTKGGRDEDRWVPVTSEAQAAIDRAAEQAGPGGNLIGEGERWTDLRNELNSARETLHEHGISGYHDARAAYACDRYEQLTGHAAPVVAGEREADKVSDRDAREQIAHELGHDRTDVAAAYVGSAR